MTGTPKFVTRIARLPDVFAHLVAHPDGLRLRDLARTFEIEPDTLREDLLAFYTADVGPEMLMGLTRPGVLEFLGPDGNEDDPTDAEIVRISDPRNIDELGVERVDASEVALIYTAATSLLDIEPDNADLEAAVDVLAETMLGEQTDAAAGPAPWNRLLEPIAQAERDRVRVDVVYSRAWEAGVSERSIEPYRLVRTRRGWEVDAGPLDDDGRMRTFLLSNIRAAQVRGGDTFDLPDELPRLLEEQRRTTLVRVELPQSGRWAADMYAERVEVIDDRELDVELELELLPPLRHRLGLLMLAAGPAARVLEPIELVDCHRGLAQTLHDHFAAGVDD